MLDLALIGSAAALGIAGIPHCTAMCGAACSAACSAGGGGGSGGRGLQTAAAASLTFHAARVASYAVGGALASASVGALAALSHMSPALRPLWTLLHVAAFGLGLFLVWQGRQPAWMNSLGRLQRPTVPQPAAAGAWQPIAFPIKAAAAGGLWVAWPCGLLQSALLVASMSNTVLGGSVAMAVFAVASSGGLVLAPWAWRRWGGSPQAQRGATRLAGALLVGASGFALGHGLWNDVAAFCGLG